MKRTSRYLERGVFQLYFQGNSNLEIGLKLGIPPSTVSDILLLLPETVTPLEDLAKDLKKFDSTIPEAKKGLQLISRLDNLGVSLERLQSFLESTEKICTSPDYEPSAIVRGAIRLNELEKTTGKSYSETLTLFEEKAENIKELEAREYQLTEEIMTLKAEKKRKTAENNVTEKDVDYIVSLRRNLGEHDIKLDDVENIRKFLQNMEEAGMDPRIFVQYTVENDSLRRKTALLQQKEQEDTLRLKNLEEKAKLAQAEVDRSLTENWDLNRQIKDEQKRLTAVRSDIAEANQRYAQKLVNLGKILSVEVEAQQIGDALVLNEKRLEKLNAEIAEKEAQKEAVQRRELELQNQNKNLEHEIKEKLKINDCATESSSALEAINKEFDEKREKIAVADTITAFLTKETPYDFNRFYSYVEQIRMLRESGKYPQSLQLTIAEEQTRTLALKAFDGHLATTAENAKLRFEKETSDRAKAETETKISQLEAQLETTEKEKQFIEAIRVNFEGRSVTVKDLKEWVVSTYWQRIEKKAKERSNAIAAGIYGTLEFFAAKITSRFENDQSGQQ